MKERKKEQYTTEWCGEGCGNDFSEYDFSDRKNHLVEKDLAHLLESQPDVEFDNLVIRRISKDAVCLEGVVKTEGDSLDIKEYIKTLYGVDKVLNRLVVRPPSAEEETVYPTEDEGTVTDWR